MWPSMVKMRVNALHLTHPSAHTAVSSEQHIHTVNTHPDQWAAIYAVAPEEQLGVRCLAQGSHLIRVIEVGASTGQSLPPPTIPAGPETRTRDLWVTSPTLYLLGHDCPNPTPRLPSFATGPTLKCYQQGQY